MVRKFVFAFLAIALLLGCADHSAYKSRKKQREGYPPEIVDYYADQVIRPGAPWRVYLRFKDSDCDMTYIVADLWQSGVGPHGPSYTPIRETGCREIVGFLALDTPTDQGLVQDQLDLKVYVRDRRGNRSRAINLTLNFDWKSSEQLPEHWKRAPSNRLGTILIDLVSSQSFQGSDGS
jgi:hypothetical protein